MTDRVTKITPDNKEISYPKEQAMSFFIDLLPKERSYEENQRIMKALIQSRMDINAFNKDFKEEAKKRMNLFIDAFFKADPEGHITFGCLTK